MGITRLAGIALLGAALAGAAMTTIRASHFADNFKRPNMTPLSPRLQQIFAQTRTGCFGRFLIDVPATATVIFGRATVKYEISSATGEAGLVEKHIAEKLVLIDENDFLNKKLNTPTSLYPHVIEGGVPGQKTVVGADDGSYKIYSYAPVGADLFIWRCPC